ncbi:hypothetical protein PIB30_091405 [Stylosanthes scabra]|uniref:Putative plant transposon protein domain-containing protein n=1 Tax=Stylosanthes scabra TaxID=79078 RepID=A0ABU6WSZ6_9FABA|nr:hypothetical protein [Stylosanthes scabra]
MDISKLLVQEFYANSAVSDEEAAAQEELPYKSFVRGKEIDFSPNNIRRVMRFKRETAGSQTDYKTRQALNQRLDEPLARGWQEFIIYSLVPTGNKSEITTSRAILIHTIMQGEDVRAEEIIADNIVTIAQGLASKGNLAHPSTIYKLCKDAGVPLSEFARTPRIPSFYITAKRMETIRKNEERKLEEQKGRKLEHFARAPTPRRGDSRLGVQNSNPGVDHPRLGMDTNAYASQVLLRAKSSTPRRQHQRLGVAQQASSTPKVFKAHA